MEKKCIKCNILFSNNFSKMCYSCWCTHDISRDKVSNYYVYGWYKPNEQLPFYIGRGKHNRAYSQHTVKNKTLAECQKVWNTVPNCRVELIKSDITFYESVVLEDTLIQQYNKLGAKLTNVKNPPEST